jgi:hypothetical protein
MSTLQKSAEVDWDKVKKYLAAGLLLGGGAGLGTSLINQIVNARKELDKGSAPSKDVIKIHLPPKVAEHASERVPSPDWEGSMPAEMASELIASEGREKHHLIKNPFAKAQVKSASINKSADPMTNAYAIVATVLGTMGAYSGTRGLYQAARKKNLQKELEDAQNVYLQRMSEKRSAFGRKKDFSLTDKLFGVPMAAWLLGAVGSGAITNRLLAQIMHENKPQLATYQPKRVEVMETPSIKTGSAELKITESHIRHLIKTAIAKSVMSDKPMSWLADTGLVDAAIATKYGFDIFRAADIEGDPLNFQKAGAIYFGTHDIARDELNEALRHPIEFIADSENRRWLNEAASRNLTKVAAALGAHCFRDGVWLSLSEKMAGSLETVWDVLPEFVAIDDAGCPQEKWAVDDPLLGSVRNVLSTKVLYENVIKPAVLGGEDNKEEQVEPVEDKDEKKDDTPEIIADDPQSKAFVSRNKHKIEEIVEKAATDVTGASNFGAPNVGTTTPFPPPTPKTDQTAAKIEPSEKVKRLADYLSKESEAEGKGEIPADLEKKIIDFVTTTESLDDSKFHAFVTALGIDPHEAEEVVYRKLQEASASGLNGASQGESVEVPPAEMAIGKKVESEHSSDPKVQEKIVKDHEVEEKDITGKPNYYTGGAKALFADIAQAKKEAGVLLKLIKSGALVPPANPAKGMSYDVLQLAKALKGSRAGASKNMEILPRDMGGSPVSQDAEGSGLGSGH